MFEMFEQVDGSASGAWLGARCERRLTNQSILRRPLYFYQMLAQLVDVVVKLTRNLRADLSDLIDQRVSSFAIFLVIHWHTPKAAPV